MDNVTLEDDVMVNNSIVCSNVTVKQKAKVLNSQVSFGAVIENGIQLKSEVY